MDTTTITKPTATQQKMYSVRETFNLPEVPPSTMLPGLEPGMPGVPPIDTNYVFEIDTLRRFAVFWVGGFTALKIEGDPSAGKTSLLAQIHARLNVPMYLVPCSPSTETYQLIGQMLPTEDGRLKWHDGPVLRACREGTSCCLDEYNTLDPGQATGLNALMEGYSWTIPETGEIVTPKPTTRFFATQNPEDSKAAVAGRNHQDVANEDRWSYMVVDYIKSDTEKALVKRHLESGGVKGDIAATIATLCVDVANDVRIAFRNDAPNIDKPISTRVVLRWAKYTAMFQAPLQAQRKSHLHYAMRQAVRMSATMASAVNEMITMRAGYDENLNSRTAA